MYCLTLTGWQWLMSFICIPVRMNLIKAHGGKGSRPFSFERIGPLSSPSRSCLGRLILHPWNPWRTGGGGGCVKAPQQKSVHLFIIILRKTGETFYVWKIKQIQPWKSLIFNLIFGYILKLFLFSYLDYFWMFMLAF